MSVLSEEWRDVPGYEGRYQVSDLGNVRSIGIGGNGHRGKTLRPTLNGPKRRQYPRVRLCRDGVSVGRFVHVLVMLAFEGPPPNGHEIDHLDNDSLNPRYSNLEYVTRPEQQRRAYRRDGRAHPNKGGELSPVSKFTWDQVREIRRRLAAKEISGRALARELKVSQRTISDIHTGRNWKEVAHVGTQ